MDTGYYYILRFQSVYSRPLRNLVSLNFLIQDIIFLCAEMSSQATLVHSQGTRAATAVGDEHMSILRMSPGIDDS